MDYYKRYMGDYGKRTARISMLEHGAYTLLMDDYYSTQAPLPAEPDALYRICRAMTKAEQTAVMSVAEQFFPIGEDGKRHQSRIDEELSEWAETAERSRANGRKGGRPKNPGRNPEITQGVSKSKPTNIPSSNPVCNPAPNPDEKLSGTQKKPSSDSDSDSAPESRLIPNSQEAREDGASNPEITQGVSGNQGEPGSIARGASGGGSNSQGSQGQGLLKPGNSGEPAGGHPGLTLEQARELQAEYPAGIYRQSEWLVVQKLVNGHLDDGVSFQRILASFRRYRLQCEARRSIGTEFVQSPVKHCDRQHPQFDEPFPLPRTAAESRQDATIEAGQEFLREMQS